MLSGGFSGGLDPPAFQRAERERVKKTLSKENADVSVPLFGIQVVFLSPINICASNY